MSDTLLFGADERSYLHLTLGRPVACHDRRAAWVGKSIGTTLLRRIAAGKQPRRATILRYLLSSMLSFFPRNETAEIAFRPRDFAGPSAIFGGGKLW